MDCADYLPDDYCDPAPLYDWCCGTMFTENDPRGSSRTEHDFDVQAKAKQGRAPCSRDYDTWLCAPVQAVATDQSTNQPGAAR